MAPFSWLVVVLGGLLALFVLRAIRRESVRVEYSLVWLAGALIFVALVLAHEMLAWAAGLLGLASTPLLIMLLALVMLVFVCFHYAKILSRLRDDNIALVQRVAILQFKVEQLEDEDRR